MDIKKPGNSSGGRAVYYVTNYSLTLQIGISRFTLWRNEINVSVAVTPGIS